MIVENRKPVVDLWGEEVIEPRHLEHRSSPVVIIDEDERQIPQDLQRRAAGVFPDQSVTLM